MNYAGTSYFCRLLCDSNEYKWFVFVLSSVKLFARAYIIEMFDVRHGIERYGRRSFFVLSSLKVEEERLRRDSLIVGFKSTSVVSLDTRPDCRSCRRPIRMRRSRSPRCLTLPDSSVLSGLRRANRITDKRVLLMNQGLTMLHCAVGRGNRFLYNTHRPGLACRRLPARVEPITITGNHISLKSRESYQAYLRGNIPLNYIPQQVIHWA